MKGHIRKDYHTRLPQLRRDLCARCRYAGYGEKVECSYNLLPITSKGENCPYFKLPSAGLSGPSHRPGPPAPFLEHPLPG